MDWSVFSLDLKYSVHKIYGYRVKTFHLLVTERTPIENRPKEIYSRQKKKKWSKGERGEMGNKLFCE